MNLNLRELHRKERGQAEVNLMCANYDSKCGECITYKVDPKDLENYYHAKELKKI